MVKNFVLCAVVAVAGAVFCGVFPIFSFAMATEPCHVSFTATQPLRRNVPIVKANMEMRFIEMVMIRLL